MVRYLCFIRSLGLLLHFAADVVLQCLCLFQLRVGMEAQIEFAFVTFTGTIKFAFKVHQNVGGFNESCTSKFSEVSEMMRKLTKEENPDGAIG